MSSLYRAMAKIPQNSQLGVSKNRVNFFRNKPVIKSAKPYATYFINLEMDDSS